MTALAAPAAGRTAMIFAPRPNDRAAAMRAGALIDATAMGCRNMGVDLAQALIDPVDSSGGIDVRRRRLPPPGPAGLPRTARAPLGTSPDCPNCLPTSKSGLGIRTITPA